MKGLQNRIGRRLWLCAAIAIVLVLVAGIHSREANTVQARSIGPAGNSFSIYGTTGNLFSSPEGLTADNVEVVGHYGGVTRDVALQGNYAYAGEGPRLTVLDMTNPAAPVVAGKSPVLPGIVFGIAVAGDNAYVASDEGGLQIVNIANPAAPTWVGEYDTPDAAYGVAVAGNYAYVADHTGGLRVINVTNPGAPVEAGFYNTPGAAYDVAVAGNYAYVADWIYGLRIVDVSNPTMPVEAGFYQNPGGASSVLVIGPYAYVAAGGSGLRIINVANPAAPFEVGAYDIARDVYDVAVNGDYAYLAGWDDGLRIVNISNPAAPAFVKLHNTPGYLNRVAVAGNYVFAADIQSGLRIVNVATPAAPFEAAFYETAADAEGLDVAGNHAYIANDDSGLWIANVANPAAPVKAGSYDLWDEVGSVVVAGNYAFMSGEYYFTAINVSNPAAPSPTGSYPTEAWNAAVSGSLAHVADGSGLQIIDVSNPAAMNQLAYLSTPGLAYDVALAGNYAYMAGAGGGLRVIDIANPASPSEVGSAPTWYARGVAVAGNYAYIADWGEGLRIIHVATPAAPVVTGWFDTPGVAYDVVVDGSYAYVADGYGGLRVINVANPAAPFEAGFYDTAGDAVDVFLSGGYIYIADREGGLLILNFVPPPPPTVSGFTPVAGRTGVTVTINGTHLNGASAVTFGGVPATSFNVNSPTQITAVVPAGATTGPIAVTTPGGTSASVASFTVIPNQPPDPPANPSPADGAIDVPVDVVLSWSGSDPEGDPLEYDVYFTYSNPPTTWWARQAGTSYAFNDLDFGATYYWQIVAHDDRGGVTPSPIWSFTTEEYYEPPSVMLNPIADAYTSSAYPTTNYGTAATLRVKEAAADLYSFLKFDASALACAQVNKATLRLYVTDASPNAGSIYAIGSSWSEGTINWNNDPAISGSPLDSPGAAPLNTWVEFDVTGGVALGTPFSFGIKGNVTDVVYYSSRESGRKPELVIEYTEIVGNAPAAAFSAAPLSGNAPLAVTFANSSTGCPTSYLWNFGDGTTSTAANPTHTYAAPGSYTVSLTATNGQGSDTETKTGYITVTAPPPGANTFFVSPSASATIGGLASTPADILRYEKATNRWTMVYDGSVRGTPKNVSAFDVLDDGSILLVFSANQPLSINGAAVTVTPYDVVKFTPNNPTSFPLGAGTYTWFFQGKPKGLTTLGEKIDALDLSGGRLLLSTTGAAAVPLPNGTTLKAADEDVFVFNTGTNQWESPLLIDGSLIPGMAVEDLASIWDDPDSGDYTITIVGAFVVDGVKGNGKSLVKLTPNGGATVFTPSLVQWLAPGATFPTNLDAIGLIR